MCSLRTIKYKHMCSIWIMAVCAHQYSCFQCISGICTAWKPTNATGIRIRCQQLPALGYQTLQAEIRACAYPTCSYIRITMIRQLLFCYCCGKTQGQKIIDLSLVKGNRGKKKQQPKNPIPCWGFFSGFYDLYMLTKESANTGYPERSEPLHLLYNRQESTIKTMRLPQLGPAQV